MQVLFYYRGMKNTDQPMGGTARMFYVLARACAAKHPTVLAGGCVQRSERVGNLHIIKVPEEDLQAWLDSFDLLVFSSLAPGRIIKKPPYQRWVCYQHCWNIYPHSTPVYSECDIISGVSSAHCENMNREGVPAKKLRLLPNSIDHGVFKRQAQKRDKNMVMYAGALVEGKGLEVLFQAFGRLAKARTCTLHIYGDAAMVGGCQEYERQIIKAGEAVGAQFHGAVTSEQLASAMATASVICLPSQLESFGLVTVEAQACGCIPVVHDTGGTSSTLQHQTTGLLYKENDPSMLALNLVYALETADKMRESARDFAHRFSDQALSKAFWNILKEFC